MSNASACYDRELQGRGAGGIDQRDGSTDVFFDKVPNSTVRYDSDEGHFFATPQCGNLMGSSEGPILFLAAYALPIIRWNLRTEAWERNTDRCRRE